MGVRVRVMTRDVHSPVAAELAALGAEIVPGDVTDPDPAPLARAVAGCTRVVACFGAQRISKISDLFAKPHETDPTHPAAVNHRGVRALVAGQGWWQGCGYTCAISCLNATTLSLNVAVCWRSAYASNDQCSPKQWITRYSSNCCA